MTSENEVKLVIERLRTNPSNVKLSIGKFGTFNTEQMIDEVQKQSDVGKLIVELHFRYLRSFKEEI